VLHHQIHPLKPATDLVGWLPSIALALAMLRWMNFERQRARRA
jgi:hypothetical protein